MKSLAEHLGTADPRRPDEPADPAPSPRMTAKEFCKGILFSEEYRRSLVQRIQLGELPAVVECLLYHYAYGKPTEHVKVEGVTPRLEDLTAEELEARALFLADVARRMRIQEMDNASSDEDDAASSSSVH